MKSSQSLRENDAKFQTHSPSTVHIKIPNLPKIYNFSYKISVGILMKLFFLSHKYLN